MAKEVLLGMALRRRDQAWVPERRAGEGERRKPGRTEFHADDRLGEVQRFDSADQGWWGGGGIRRSRHAQAGEQDVPRPSKYHAFQVLAAIPAE